MQGGRKEIGVTEIGKKGPAAGLPTREDEIQISPFVDGVVKKLRAAFLEVLIGESNRAHGVLVDTLCGERKQLIDRYFLNKHFEQRKENARKFAQAREMLVKKTTVGGEPDPCDTTL